MQKSQLFANQMEKLKREKYNPDNIFKNKKSYLTSIENNISTETAMIEYKEKSLIQKLFDKIKNLFKRNN